MKESHRKGVASHPDPESCGVDRKGGAEALTGARAGEVWSREINTPGTPTPLVAAEGNTGRDASASPSWVQRGRRPSACTETPRAGTGISHGSPRTDGTVERAGKAGGRTPAMHGHGKSDRPEVPRMQTNKVPLGTAEPAEGRGLAKGNLLQPDTSRTQSRKESVPGGLERVRVAAKRDRKARFTALSEGELGARCRLSWLDAIDHEWLLRFLEHRIAGKTADFASVARTAVSRHDPRQEPGAVVPHAGICAGGPG